MKSILEAIKKYPNEFCSSAYGRSCTTPNPVNFRNHVRLEDAIKHEDWDTVSEVIADPAYTKPLEGVIYCLSHYSDLNSIVICDIVDLLEDKKFI